LDYIQIGITLCDVLVFAYQKFLDNASSSSSSPSPSSNAISKDTYTLLIKVDGRFKHHVISSIAKDFNNVAFSVLKQQVASLESVYGSKS